MLDPAFSVQGAYISHPGTVRDKSEDAIFFQNIHVGEKMESPFEASYDGNSSWMILLADGLSGQKAGELASNETITSLLYCQEPTPFVIQASLREINRNLFARGQNDPSLTGLGATIVGLASGPDGIFAFNVGDARIYRQQDQFLNLVSYDDCLSHMVGTNDPDAGKVTMKKVKSHILTQSLGGTVDFREVTPHLFPLLVKSTTTFLLCTDGLPDAVGLEQLEEIMRKQYSPRVMVEELFAKAMANGARDNVTLAVAEVTPL